MASWVRNAIALTVTLGWIAYIGASIIRGTIPEWYVWGIPVTILTGLPSIPIRKSTRPPADHPQEDTR